MKTILNNIPTFKKMLFAMVFYIAVNENLSAQCNATFSYTSSNSSISATSTSTGTTSTSSYNWTLANVSGSTLVGSGSSSPVFNSLYNGTYQLYFTLIDSVGCNSTSATQTITISGGTNAPSCASIFTYTAGSAGLVSFTNTSPTDPLNNTIYSLDFGDGTYSNISSNINHTYYYDSTYFVTLTVHNPISTCSSTSTQTIIISNANPIPTCTAAFTYTLGSAGAVNFTGSYTGTGTGIAYTWNFGNGISSSAQNPSYTYPYNGTYTVTLNIQDSLAACYSSANQTLTITNAATAPCTPTVTFNMHQDSLNPQPGVWQASSYYSPQVTSAVWHWGDGSSTTGFAPTHTYASAGQYSICVTVYSSCGDSSTNCQYDSLFRLNHNNVPSSVISVTVVDVNGVGSTSGIKTNSNETEQISIYPNPSQGLFILQINNISSSVTKAQISITNILGGIVYCSQEQMSNNTISKEIDLQNISNGAYFMKVNIGDKTYTNKIIISK